jgi:hypothetical protein
VKKSLNQALSSISVKMALAQVRVFWMRGLSGAFAKCSTRIRRKPRAFSLRMCCSGVGSAIGKGNGGLGGFCWVEQTQDGVTPCALWV